MHLKPEDIRKAMENAKALGIIGDKKSKGGGGLMANANLVWEFRVEILTITNQPSLFFVDVLSGLSP